MRLKKEIKQLQYYDSARNSAGRTTKTSFSLKPHLDLPVIENTSPRARPTVPNLGLMNNTVGRRREPIHLQWQVGVQADVDEEFDRGLEVRTYTMTR